MTASPCVASRSEAHSGWLRTRPMGRGLYKCLSNSRPSPKAISAVDVPCWHASPFTVEPYRDDGAGPRGQRTTGPIPCQARDREAGPRSREPPQSSRGDGPACGRMPFSASITAAHAGNGGWLSSRVRIRPLSPGPRNGPLSPSMASGRSPGWEATRRPASVAREASGRCRSGSRRRRQRRQSFTPRLCREAPPRARRHTAD